LAQFPLLIAVGGLESDFQDSPHSILFPFFNEKDWWEIRDKVFIKRGAAAVIATACPMPDAFAAAFARVFYR